MGLLDDRVAVVTGGGGGIGSAIVRALAGEGAAVVVNDYGVTVDGRSPSSEAADAVVAEVTACGGRAVAHYGSVADFGAAQDLMQTALSRFGRLDAVVTPHGILRERMIFNMSPEEWGAVISVHLDGTFNCVRLATEIMRSQRSGSLVLVTSTAGLEGSAGQANYSAAKLGIVGLAYATTLAMGKYDVNVNVLAPAADTRMTQRLDNRFFADRPNISPDTVGAVAAALCSPAARHITGQVFTSAGEKVARWSHPVEEQVAFRDGPWTAETALETLTRTFTNPLLARFARQGLVSPGIGGGR